MSQTDQASTNAVRYFFLGGGEEGKLLMMTQIQITHQISNSLHYFIHTNTKLSKFMKESERLQCR